MRHSKQPQVVSHSSYFSFKAEEMRHSQNIILYAKIVI